VGVLAGVEEKKEEQGIAGLDGFKLEACMEIDYNRGILNQLLEAEYTFDEYVKFINEPKHLVNPVRDLQIFENPIIEALSKTPWFAIPIAYLPVIFYYLTKNELSLSDSLLIYFLGFAAWTLAEYMLHRFLFHLEDQVSWSSKRLCVFHFIIHGIHHAFPMDKHRLVFPVIPGYILYSLIFIPLFNATLPTLWVPCLSGGFLSAYILYDMVHYFLHHSQPASAYWKDMKLYHMQHHYKNGKLGFGVSSKFWDYVFQTQIR